MSQNDDICDKQCSNFVCIIFGIIVILGAISIGAGTNTDAVGILSFAGILTLCITLFFCCYTFQNEGKTPCGTTESATPPRRRIRTPPRRSTRPRRPIPTTSRRAEQQADVTVETFGDFVENRFRFGVIVTNRSRFALTDLRVQLVSFPRKALELCDDDDVYFPKIEHEGQLQAVFEFLPTQDCVRGRIIAVVAYLDESGKAFTVSTEPFVIRAVCDLLQAEKVTSKEFELKLQNLSQEEIAFRIEDWTPREAFDNALRVLRTANFHEVSNDFSLERNRAFGRIYGWARGKYTNKSLAVDVSISGINNRRGTKCQVIVLGEDQAMVLPAIDELRERLTVWVCPYCGCNIPLSLVMKLRAGEPIECKHCHAAITQ